MTAKPSFLHLYNLIHCPHPSVTSLYTSSPSCMGLDHFLHTLVQACKCLPHGWLQGPLTHPWHHHSWPSSWCFAAQSYVSKWHPFQRMMHQLHRWNAAVSLPPQEVCCTSRVWSEGSRAALNDLKEKDKTDKENACIPVCKQNKFSRELQYHYQASCEIKEKNRQAFWSYTSAHVDWAWLQAEPERAKIHHFLWKQQESKFWARKGILPGTEEAHHTTPHHKKLTVSPHTVFEIFLLEIFFVKVPTLTSMVLF